MNSIDYFDSGWRRDPWAVCLINGETGESHSYEQVYRMTHLIACALRAHQVELGVHVAVLANNTPMGFTCVLSILRSGAVWLPLNPRNAVSDNAKILSQLDCEVLFYESAFADLVPSLLKQASAVRICVCLDSVAGNPLDSSQSLKSWLLDAVGEEAVEYPDLPADPERIFAIQSTGGTTGLPKGVMMPCRALNFIVRTFLTVAPFEGRPVFLAVAPLTHAAGMVLQHLFTLGGSAVLYAKVGKPALLESIERYRITHTFLPPTVIYELLAQPTIRAYDYSSLRYFFYGASPMAPDKLREAIEVFGPVMAQIYGQTEAGVPLTFLSPADHLQDDLPASSDRLSSAGRVTPFAEVNIIDDALQLVDEGVAGEVVVRGDGLMLGYYKDLAATAEVQWNGWLRTGDIGRFDKHGYLYIVDRSRDLIISGGFNIFSAEVERAVLSHEEVQDCAVIGLPDAKWGEAVLAVVVRRPGSELGAEALISHCKETVGSMKSPKRVEFVDDLPRSAVGKVLKRELKQRYWSGKDRLVS